MIKACDVSVMLQGVQPIRKNSAFLRAQLNEVCLLRIFVAEDFILLKCLVLPNLLFLKSSVSLKDPVDGSTAAKTSSESAGRDAKPLNDKESSKTLATEESISEFITQVSSLIKLAS